MVLIRRFLVLAVLFFWQGGFTFYASVVVPVAQHELGHRRQGFVTRQVTVYLNIAGAVALSVLLGDLLTASHTAWRRGRWFLWAGMLVCLLVLFWLHGRLDESLVVEGRLLRDAEVFRSRHRLYLWISTVQWVFGLLYLVLALVSWRVEDRPKKMFE